MGSSSELSIPCLALEASGDPASVALKTTGGKQVEVVLPGQRGRTLISSVQQLCQETQVDLSDLGVILVGTGPGSYTGLRIACAGGRMLAHALNIPVHGICSFHAAAWVATGPARRQIIQNAYRGEAYHALFERTEQGMTPLQEPQVVATESVPELLDPEAMLLGELEGVDPNSFAAWAPLQPTAKALLSFAQSECDLSPDLPEPLYLRTAR